MLKNGEFFFTFSVLKDRFKNLVPALLLKNFSFFRKKKNFISEILLKSSREFDRSIPKSKNTFGKVFLKDPVNVTIDNTVVLPRDTLAGIESCGIQKSNQDSTTSIIVGK